MNKNLKIILIIVGIIIIFVIGFALGNYNSEKTYNTGKVEDLGENNSGETENIVDLSEKNNNTKNELAGESFIETYNVLHIAESNSEEYIYLTVRQFQAEEIETVKVQRSLASKVEVDKYYEFTFIYTESLVEDNIKSIFENTILSSIVETDKMGLEQINDSIGN